MIFEMAEKRNYSDLSDLGAPHQNFYIFYWIPVHVAADEDNDKMRAHVHNSYS
jgi:hypothetical protein